MITAIRYREMEAIVASNNQQVDDPEALLNVWLGELDNLTLGLDKVSSSIQSEKPPVNDVSRPLSSDLNAPRIDSLRYSMANMEDTQDVDLDAILGELCALENEYEEAIRTTNVASRKSGDMSSREVNSPNNNSRLSQLSTGRTHSPDNDSAYSDSLSLLSSESSTSTRPDLHHPQNESQNAIVHNAPTSKAEKIRLAMQKIKEASVKKIFVKVFNDDGSVKSLLVDETMTCGYITRVLAEKNHRPYDPRCALVEHLTDLNMERVYEENELLVTELMRWTYSSKNRLHFSWDRPEKTLLFDAPWLFVGPADPRRDREPAHHHSPSPQNIAILEEFFAGSGVPSVEGPLYIKSDSSRKGWKRYHCILRSSGLYYWPKDKAKCSSKDLICLATFDVNMVYYGVGWKKRFKAPTDHCFALKHPALQEQPKSSKYIKYLCADDPTSLHRWVTAVRLVKYGRQLLTDYKSSLEECRHVDLVSQRPPSSSSSSSSGCDVGFESDFPCGTIKRKPAKIPLTSTTRQLKSAAIGEEECYLDEDLPPPPPELMVDDDDEDVLPTPNNKTSASRNSLFLGSLNNPRFLEDLHRVVEKKWQVAEKCRLEVGTSPHQVLGFRDYDKCLGVSQWVEEHYGGSIGSSSSGGGGGGGSSGGGSLGARGRGPAPPPPPRAPTTVLSRR